MSTGHIRTSSGILFNVWDPDPDQIHILDIAEALSKLCRFTGHVRQFYSVAEHCVLVSHMVPESDALWGLLHDATEAYVGDMSFPLKNMPEMQPYRDAEARVAEAVVRRFGLPPEEPLSVKLADRELCRQEGKKLIKGWNLEPTDKILQTIGCWSPERAWQEFLHRYNVLTQ